MFSWTDKDSKNEHIAEMSKPVLFIAQSHKEAVGFAICSVRHPLSLDSSEEKLKKTNWKKCKTKKKEQTNRIT